MPGDHCRFTGFEFQILWRHLGRDRLPFPLRHRPVADTQDDLDRQRREATAAVLPRVTESLHGHLSVLAEPDRRIEVAGFAADTTPVRMHAGIRGTRAALAIQLPDSDVLVRGLDAGRVPEAIASALPAVPAGSWEPIRFRRADLQAGRGALLTPAGSSGPRERAFDLLRRPRTAIGEITAFAGAAYDGRPTTDGVGLHWLDFQDDGRYSLREAADIVVAPASVSDLATQISRLLDEIRSRASMR